MENHGWNLIKSLTDVHISFITKSCYLAAGLLVYSFCNPLVLTTYLHHFISSLVEKVGWHDNRSKTNITSYEGVGRTPVFKSVVTTFFPGSPWMVVPFPVVFWTTMTFGLEVTGMVVIFVVVPVSRSRTVIHLTLPECVQARPSLTRHNVTADDLPTKRGQRLGHDCDDATTGGLYVGGPATRGWYPGPNGTNSGSCVGGLGSCD